MLIIGGQGRIGSSVAADLITHAQSEVVITGRTEKTGEAFCAELGPRAHFRRLDLDDQVGLQAAMSDVDLVIHCAGPFHHRSTAVLKLCIENRVDYLDVSDDRGFTIDALALRDEARAAGITAIVNSGIFPGISNSMVRQGVEQLDTPEEIHLSYVVQGSGGAGITVMRTTFLGLQHPFDAWIDGAWKQVAPYSERETVHFPGSGPGHVYWFDMPESYTLAKTFPVKTVVTKFGVDPHFYNRLTWMASHWFPKPVLRSGNVVEFLSQVSHRMTSVTDKFSGIGVRMRAKVTGFKDGKPATHTSILIHENTTVACGIGTGSLAELMVAGLVHQPGVWTVDEALPTSLFEKVMASRNLQLL